MALSTRRMLMVIATLALGAALALTVTSLVESADSSPAEAAKKKKKKLKVTATCENHHALPPPDGNGEDFAEAAIRARREAKKGGQSSALKNVKGAVVSAKFTDLTPADGDNALTKTAQAKTAANGVAELSFQFNNFGDYEIKYRVSKKGYKAKSGSLRFHVKDRVSGACATFK